MALANYSWVIGALVTSFGLIALAIALWPRKRDRTVTSYLAASKGETVEEVEEQLDAAQTPLARLRAITRAFGADRTGRVTGSDKVAQKLVLSDLPLTPEEWLIARLVIAVVVGGLLTLRFGLLIGAVGAILVPLFGGSRFVAFRQKRREKKFEKQLVDAIDVLSGGVKAGFSLVQALDLVSKRLPEPAATEFGRAAQEIKLGLSVDDALTHLAVRNRSRELTLLCNALRIWRQTGGNVSTILDSVRNTLRARIALKGEVSTLTAQARLSGWIIGLLPVALVGILSLITPTYLQPMFTNPIGIGLLMFGAFLIASGAFAMSRLSKLDF
jgi:tight adherence protein B